MIDYSGGGVLGLVVLLAVGAIYHLIKEVGAKEERAIQESLRRAEAAEKRRGIEAKQRADAERERKLAEMSPEQRELYRLRNIADVFTLRTPEALVEHHIQVGVWDPEHREEELAEVRKKWGRMQSLPEI
jgi:hypothetical protein